MLISVYILEAKRSVDIVWILSWDNFKADIFKDINNKWILTLQILVADIDKGQFMNMDAIS